MSGPSDKATERAISAAGGMYGYDHQHTRAALAAAHNPALGLDRSVCLRDVVGAIRDDPRHTRGEVADFIEREFAASPADEKQ